MPMAQAKKKIEEVCKTDNILQKREKFLKSLELKNGNISQACKAINISRQTFYAWSEDEDFKIKAENVKESLLDLAESKLMENINSL